MIHKSEITEAPGMNKKISPFQLRLAKTMWTGLSFKTSFSLCLIYACVYDETCVACFTAFLCFTLCLLLLLVLISLA